MNWLSSSTKASTPQPKELIGPLPEGRGVLGCSSTTRNPLARQHPRSPGIGGISTQPPTHAHLPRRARAHPRRGLRKPVPEREGRRRTLQRDDEVLAEALAAAAGIAIDNARLFEQTQTRQSWIEATRDIGTQLLGGADPAQVFRLIADEALSLTRAHAVLVAVPTDTELGAIDVDQLVVVETAGSAGWSRPIPVVGTLIGQVFADRTPAESISWRTRPRASRMRARPRYCRCGPPRPLRASWSSRATRAGRCSPKSSST